MEKLKKWNRNIIRELVSPWNNSLDKRRKFTGIGCHNRKYLPSYLYPGTTIARDRRFHSFLPKLYDNTLNDIRIPELHGSRYPQW